MHPSTLQAAIEHIAAQFTQANLYYGHGTASALDEAAWAVHHVLNIPFGDDELIYQQNLKPEQWQAIEELVKARISSRKPMAYLTNKMWFAGLEFYVDERTLVPRSPIAELILNNWAPWLDASKIHTVLDLCTGSACIALAIAHYFPDVQVVASDISTDALSVAEINRQNMGLEDRVYLVESDLFAQIPSDNYDLIISNPPYVPSAVMSELPSEYLQEPSIGLVSGNDGLQHVERILRESINYLSADGAVIIEVGLAAEALNAAHPTLDFMWLEFEYGGEGVFMLTAKQLRDYFSQL